MVMSMVFSVYSHIAINHVRYHPELRVGQLMSNFEQWLKTKKGIDIFYLENMCFLILFKEYLSGGEQ
jgi:hypothetical protein